jgi:FtsH-binding integral membrane protein
MEMQDRFVTRTSAQEAIDVGLREHMLRVYNYMASGLALSGIVAYLIANTGVKSVFFSTAATGQVSLTLFGILGMLAPLAFVLVLSFGINRLSFPSAQAVFWAYTATMGVSLALILLQFTGASVARVFFITAGTFAAMSLYGYTTKRDLSQFGSFLMMGLIGLIIASVVNFFVGSSALQFAISVIGVLLFVGLTAYDTQRIKEVYLESDSSEIAGKKALMGALTLYLDFINLFTFLMQLLGTRRD